MSKEYSPEVIAQSFIKQFYEMMAKNPGELHRFYKSESTFSHAEGHQITETVTGVEKIRERVSMLNLAGARLDLSEGSIDAQRSEQNGVFLMVTGKFTMPQCTPRPFVQSFFLACQASSTQKASMASYYVRNSAFRLGDVQGEVAVSNDASAAAVPFAAPVEVAPVTPPEVAPELQPEALPSVADIAATATDSADQNGSALAPDASPAPADAPEVDADATAAPVVVSSFEEYVAETQFRVEDVVDTPPSASATANAAVSSKPKSYADVAKWTDGTVAPAPAPAPTTRKAKAARGANAASADPAKETSAAPPAAAAVEESEGSAATRPPRSIYVNQVHASVTEEELLRLFGGFGVVKRASVHAGRGFAFVDFADSESVAGILARFDEEPSHFTLQGQLMGVEARVTKLTNRRGNGSASPAGFAGGNAKDRKRDPALSGRSKRSDGGAPKTPRTGSDRSGASRSGAGSSSKREGKASAK